MDGVISLRLSQASHRKTPLGFGPRHSLRSTIRTHGRDSILTNEKGGGEREEAKGRGLGLTKGNDTTNTVLYQRGLTRLNLPSKLLLKEETSCEEDLG